MSIFTAISTDADASAMKKRIEEIYPDHIQANSNVWFIKSDDLTADVAEKLGMNDDTETIGVIVKHEDWYGYTDRKIWDWGKSG